MYRLRISEQSWCFAPDFLVCVQHYSFSPSTTKGLHTDKITSCGFQINLKALPADFRSVPEHFFWISDRSQSTSGGLQINPRALLATARECEFHSLPFSAAQPELCSMWIPQSSFFSSTTWTILSVNSTAFLFHHYNLNYPECEFHSLPFSSVQPELSWVCIPQSSFFSSTTWTVQGVNSTVTADAAVGLHHELSSVWIL